MFNFVSFVYLFNYLYFKIINILSQRNVLSAFTCIKKVEINNLIEQINADVAQHITAYVQAFASWLVDGSCIL